ncbi:MAG: hypothetical protein DRJ10_07525 [Bacteroidetes bacterium]|nr:MAG: hypothetical protein DRJ10_07525 [Bacteroidota bacterium]
MGFHTTDLYSPDVYATDVLSILLAEGNDSRLYKRLVKEKELQANVLMDQIQKISTGFGLLLELNGELAKKKADQERINKLNNQLEAIVTN